MRGTDVQYNQQLGLLGAVYTIEGNNAVPRSETKQAQELTFINNHINRVFYPETSKKAGYFRYATFTTSYGTEYKITRNGELYKKTSEGYKLLKTSTKKNDDRTWAYRAAAFSKSKDSIKDVTFIEFHLLMLTCAYSNFLDLYLASKNICVNHTKILRKDIALRDHSYDALHHLEVLTSAENYWHGVWCKKLGLYDIHIEYEDLLKLAPSLTIISKLTGEKRKEAIKKNKDLVRSYTIINVYQQRKEIWMD